MDRVRISRRDTADTGIRAKSLDSSLHVQSFSLSPGTVFECVCVCLELLHILDV